MKTHIPSNDAFTSALAKHIFAICKSNGFLIHTTEFNPYVITISRSLETPCFEEEGARKLVCLRSSVDRLVNITHTTKKIIVYLNNYNFITIKHWILVNSKSASGTHSLTNHKLEWPDPQLLQKIEQIITA